MLLLADGGDSWQWLTVLSSLAAIAVSVAGVLRMAWSQGNLTGAVDQKVKSMDQRLEEISRDTQRDRKDAWDTINKLKDENQACDRERGMLKAQVEMWLSSVKSKADAPSPGHHSRPRDAT